MKVIWIVLLFVGMLMTISPMYLPEYHTKLSFTAYGFVLASFFVASLRVKKKCTSLRWRAFFCLYPESKLFFFAFAALGAYIGLPPGYGLVPHFLLIFTAICSWRAVCLSKQHASGGVSLRKKRLV